MSQDAAGERVGIFGGTFDPIHQGHLIIAEQVMESLGLSRVLFVPGGIPPHKEASSIMAATGDRVALVEAAIAGNESFVLDLTEVEAGRKMYSHETVRLLKDSYEAEEWYFISGADEVANLPFWKEPDRLLKEVYMVAATRPGHEFSELESLAGELENYHRILHVECSRVDISATGIRERLAGGRTIRYLVPERVNEEILQRGLYGVYGSNEASLKDVQEVRDLHKDVHKGESMDQETRGSRREETV
ncbi:nicotinate-nucleotide adenylyltransferase [Rubrobacter aplysinae]|uniref:nicotinate-nucleotide adenylyltransferase n=1 Tax=Rubrobacter aplysinae TaxID=909625 RepID=UPI001364D4D1|nr:nicotinate-nucleotide adenylyltransferase [Rubrobacter aplysinae]